MRLRTGLSLGIALLLTGCATGMDTAAGYDAGAAYNATAFAEWDDDNDALLSANEFDSNYDDTGVFDAWDTGDDGYVDEFEWNTATEEWNNVGTFDDFDANNDGLLDEDELGTGIWESWDMNDDRFLDETEFGIGADLL